MDVGFNLMVDLRNESHFDEKNGCLLHFAEGTAGWMFAGNTSVTHLPNTMTGNTRTPGMDVCFSLMKGLRDGCLLLFDEGTAGWMFGSL